MNIHVVQPGDTIYSIASSYGLDPKRLSLENDIVNPEDLIVGEAIIIINPSQTYIVKEGDTLESISNNNGIEVMELLRNNPNIANRNLYIGEELVISYIGMRGGNIKTNGFAYPFISKDILQKTLPYLTYLTIYSYEYKRDGSINDLDDLAVIELAKEYGVAPMMFITAANMGDNIDEEIAHNMIHDSTLQNTLIGNMISALKSKGYYGINLETPFILPGDRQGYVDFVANVTKHLNDQNLFVTVTIEPSAFEVSTEIIYSGTDYSGISEAANEVLFQLTYAWRYPYNIPISVLPFDTVIGTLEYATTLIPPEKCILGISNIGYLWEFPYLSRITITNFLNNDSALELARYTNSIIQFNNPTRTTYYRYIENEREYMAWFKDNRVIYPMLVYSQGYGLQGISIWSIMHFITNTWLMINAQYTIEKII